MLEFLHFTWIDLLDILMPALSGIELGRAIRSRDDSCAIIYCTAAKEFGTVSSSSRTHLSVTWEGHKTRLKVFASLALR